MGWLPYYLPFHHRQTMLLFHDDETGLSRKNDIGFHPMASLEIWQMTLNIVIPVIVDSHGSFVSHDLTHHIRHTRSTLSSSISTHVNISGFGQTFQIDLIEERKLLAPGFKVYHRHNNNNNSHSESFVMLSLQDKRNTLCEVSYFTRMSKAFAGLHHFTKPCMPSSTFAPAK
jgi:hypothetical protein